MLLMTQDHDDVIIYNKTQDTLVALPALHEDLILGFNLYCNHEFLGSFDSVAEVVAEINAIQQHETFLYMVSGYSDWEGLDELFS